VCALTALINWHPSSVLLSTHGIFWAVQDVKDSLVGPMEQVARKEWAGQEGLDEHGQPLPGVVPLNLLYR